MKYKKLMPFLFVAMLIAYYSFQNLHSFILVAIIICWYYIIKDFKLGPNVNLSVTIFLLLLTVLTSVAGHTSFAINTATIYYLFFIITVVSYLKKEGV